MTTMTFLKMRDLQLAGQSVLLREDLNVPVRDGRVTSDARLTAALPGIRQALAAGARLMVLSHLGRPTEGVFDEQFSLKPVAERLEQLLGQPVPLIRDWLDRPVEVKPGELVLLENVRFLAGEKKNDESLSKRMAALCDIYVMDAFGTAHRAQSSTCGLGQFAPRACAGPLLEQEIMALTRVMTQPQKPLVAIVGGAKVSGKLPVLDALSQQCDHLIVGGGIANTFLAAAGYSIGKSLYEEALVPQARDLMERVQIPLPVDVVTGKTFDAAASGQIKAVTDIATDDLIMDVGPETAQQFATLLQTAGTILWNGPVGVFEFEAFSSGTQALAQAVAQSSAFSLAGGGDTLAAIDTYGIADQISYISTGGGAFLEYMEGKTLPALAMLEERARRTS